MDHKIVLFFFWSHESLRVEIDEADNRVDGEAENCGEVRSVHEAACSNNIKSDQEIELENLLGVAFVNEKPTT